MSDEAIGSAPLRVVLLEDEPPALARLVNALREAQPNVIVAATFDTVAGARRWFLEHDASRDATDLVISDIQLADGLSLSLFVDGVIKSPVVFATAYDRYLLDAFRCTSVDYLLKPIATEDVARAIDKLARMRAALSSGASSSAPLRASDAVALTELVREPRRRILVRRGPELRAVSVDDVAFLVAEDKLTLLVTRAGTEHVIDKTLTDLERELDARVFFRANRGVIVHVEAIKAFRSAGKGRISLTLEPSPKDDVIVSQENAAAFRAFVDR